MKVLGRVILIMPDKLPERTSTGKLVIPKNSTEIPPEWGIVIPKNSTEMLPEWGTVMQSGVACRQVKEGDRVAFPRKLANVIVIDDKDYYLINEHKILYHE